jgi:hypothetical protein
MMRFYLEGKHPIGEQVLPAPMRSVGCAGIFKEKTVTNAG